MCVFVQDKVVEAFSVSVEDMGEISRRLTAACEKGLENEKEAVVKMFITYVHSLPDGTEEGDFLALDLGGSNFRVLQLSQSPFNYQKLCNMFVSGAGLERGGKMAGEPKVEEMKISKDKKEGTQEELFDFIAQSMSNFLKKHGITRRLPLGFTFSFPVAQTSLTAGTLKKWTKDFKAEGAEGRDVTEMLKQAIARRTVSSIKCTDMVGSFEGETC